MRQFLIATAALSLMGGAAFAQTAPATPAPDATPPAASATTPSTPPSTDSTPSGSMSGGSMSSGSTDSATPPADISASTATASAAPATDAPATYPVCTSKHEDRCVNRYQATRTAKLATRHQTTDNVQPAG